jgi:hypothetical protein
MSLPVEEMIRQYVANVPSSVALRAAIVEDNALGIEQSVRISNVVDQPFSAAFASVVAAVDRSVAGRVRNEGRSMPR